MSEVRVNKLSPRSGTTVTLGDSGDTITIPSGVTFDASSGGLAGTLTTAAQPNITSVGTLTSFTSTGIDDNATSTAITIDSSENVGIGATTIDNSASGRTVLQLENTSDNLLNFYVGGSRTSFLYSSLSTTNLLSVPSAPLTFGTNNSERMRIDSSGNVLVGKSSLDYTTAGTIIRSDGALFSTTNGANTAVFERLTSDGDIIRFEKDNTTVGKIFSRSGVVSGIILDPRAGGNGLLGQTGSIIPVDETQTREDNATDLGNSTYRWKDLYLGGGLYVGGTGTANKLDDYEEGTWTPEITPATGSFSAITYSNRNGHYTKIGNIVYFTMFLRTASSSNFSGASGAISITGLPFSASSTPTSRAGGSFFTAFDRWNSNSILDGSIVISTSITPSSSSIGLGSIITSSGDAQEFSVSNLRDVSATDNRIGLSGFYMTDA